MNVQFTEHSLQNILSVIEEMKLISGANRKKFINFLFKEIKLLTIDADIGKSAPEFGITNIKEIEFFNYRIIYIILNEEITILGILNKAPK